MRNKKVKLLFLQRLQPDFKAGALFRTLVIRNAVRLSAFQARMNRVLVAVGGVRQNVSQPRWKAIRLLLLRFTADVAGPAEDAGLHLGPEPPV